MLSILINYNFFVLIWVKRMDGAREGGMVGWMDRWSERGRDGKMDGWMVRERGMDGWINRQLDELTD